MYSTIKAQLGTAAIDIIGDVQPSTSQPIDDVSHIIFQKKLNPSPPLPQGRSQVYNIRVSEITHAIRVCRRTDPVLCTAMSHTTVKGLFP